MIKYRVWGKDQPKIESFDQEQGGCLLFFFNVHNLNYKNLAFFSFNVTITSKRFSLL